MRATCKSEPSLLRLLQSSDGPVPGHGGKVVEERLEGDACANKDGRTTHNARIAVNRWFNLLHLCVPSAPGLDHTPDASRCCKAPSTDVESLWPQPAGEPSRYFPMQNVEKMLVRMSSTVVSPVIASSGRSAL